MEKQTEFAPDLMRGFICNATKSGNTWSTEIQCVLAERRDDVVENRYLSYQCRRENLPFSSGYLGDKEDIFQKSTSAEFLTFTFNDKFYQLPDMDSVVPASTVSGLSSDWDGGSFFSGGATHPKWDSEVVCESVPIRVLSFDEALTGLIERRFSIRELFLRVSWSLDSTEYQIHCPCRYVNYSNPAYESRRYIQPISGYVLVPFGGLYCRGFVACAGNEKGDVLMELLVPRFHCPYGKLVAAVTGKETPEIVEQLRSTLPAVGRSFDVAQGIDGRFELFVFE